MRGVLSGYKIQISPDRPRMQLAPGDYVTPEFRAEINLWMLGFFGTTNLLKDGQTYVIHDEVIVCNPRTYAAMEKIAKPAPW